jgi:acyl-CoA dehydrogenase family protein 9
VGRGFKVAMQVLNDGRLGLAAGCVGSAKALLALSIERVQERRAFGRSIGEFALIKDKIAGMLAETFALESMVYLTCACADRVGSATFADYAVESAICKVFGSEALWRIANESLQIAAGSGYMAAFPYERLLRDARVNLIFEGTNEILRCFIALSGVQGPGRDLTDVGKALREPIKGFGLLSDFALRQAKNVLGRERLHGVHAALAAPAARFEHYVDAFSKQVQRALRRYGRNIAEMQFTLERIADMAIQLYALAACFARTTRVIHERGEEGGRREIEMTRVFSNLAMERLEATLVGFDTNDDDLRAALASKSYVDGGYPLDVV